jgi:carbamoyl-phosphate synthase
MVSDKIGTVMKSVGEVMGIGRSFQEALQKAVRQVDTQYTGVDPWDLPNWDIDDEICNPTPRRIFAIATAMARGYTVDKINKMCRVDKWFLEKMRDIIQLREYLITVHENLLTEIPKEVMLEAKAMGFSDKQIGSYVKADELAVRDHRKKLGVIPCVKQIDTVAGEFPAQCNYLYVSYNAQVDDVTFTEKLILILGCGVYRIGSSVEFDYSAVCAARALRQKLGKRVAVLNYNPETVSTDYDESDRLYFDEISVERVMDLVDKEQVEGVIISLGGQIAQNLALQLKKCGAPILGTLPENIDVAEDRSQFSRLCDSIGVSQPPWRALTTTEDALRFCKEVDFPVLVRPSYVLSGSAMSVVWNQEDLSKCLTASAKVSGKYPVVISKFFTNANEFDVDIVGHNGTILVYAISEHIEYAGVHSGDATMMLPCVTADEAT